MNNLYYFDYKRTFAAHSKYLHYDTDYFQHSQVGVQQPSAA